MGTLVKAIAAVFVAVTVLTWARWFIAPNSTDVDALPRTSPPTKEWQAEMSKDHSPRDMSASIQRAPASSPSQAPVAPEPDPHAKSIEELNLGLEMGFTYEEAMALVREMELSALSAFFAQHSHITPDWLHRIGLSPQQLRPLYARWASGASPDEWQQAPGDILLSRFSPRHDGGPYRIQSSFQAQDRTVYLHYTVPEDYTGASVVVRWVREDGGGISHFDYHPLTADPGQRQEAWARPRHGWEPGQYRVEVFSADESLRLLAQTDYQVMP